MVARQRLRHLFPKLPAQPGYSKRRHRVADTIEWLAGVFAHDRPGDHDQVVLVDSTPGGCGRSVDTSRRSQLAVACARCAGASRVAALIWRQSAIASSRSSGRSRDRPWHERHNARSLHGLRARITTKLLALAASVFLNHYLGRPTRALAALAAQLAESII